MKIGKFYLVMISWASSVNLVIAFPRFFSHEIRSLFNAIHDSVFSVRSSCSD